MLWIAAQEHEVQVTRITREDLRNWGACYSDGKIAELVPPDGLTPLQVLDLAIPLDDRIWAVVRRNVIPDLNDRLEARAGAALLNDQERLAAVRTVLRRV